MLDADHCGRPSGLPFWTARSSDQDTVATVGFKECIVVNAKGVLLEFTAYGRLISCGDKLEIRRGGLK